MPSNKWNPFEFNECRVNEEDVQINAVSSNSVHALSEGRGITFDAVFIVGILCNHNGVDAINSLRRGHYI